MSENEQLIHAFYQAFQQRDCDTIDRSYHDRAVFKDPAFMMLYAEEVRSMWHMLFSSGSDIFH